MGAENSKTESRERPRPPPRPEPPTRQQGNVGQCYTGYPHYPSSSQNLTRQPAQTHPTLERTRSPYQCSSQELNGIRKEISPGNGNLYPNLNANRPSTPVQKVQTPVTSTSNAYSSTGQGGRSQTGGFVVVNFDQPRSGPKPSAPPASEVAAEPTVRPEPLAGRPSTLRPASTSAYVPAKNTTSSSISRSNTSSPIPKSANSPAGSSISVNEYRGRATDDKYNCPTCSQHLGTTIFQCRTGHGSCQVCRQANRPCGKCAAPLTNTRNIMLEGLVAEHLLVNRSVCPNKGCTLNFNGLDMPKHLTECPFGETDCPMGKIFGQCSCRYKVEDMVSHFDVFHKDQMAEVGKEMFLFNICLDTQRVFLVKIGPYHFLVHVKVSAANRNIYVAVQLHGTAISATKWTYEVHVYNKRQPRRKFQYADNCLSIGTPIDDIFKECNCATLPLTYAMTFVNESSLTYKFYIKKTEGKWRERNKAKWNQHNQQNE